ncbi:hypothetical protein K432DRAFT_423975 [Lepidopterella palustris CBS 459.81]|uniref:C3H1-type domain-containing protein n=1 Tax=Lepidopterella palustris CBS 459.81 TaxID=1314670 RepID=A0A8E2EES2_9PEZI|nr:hypothetical protein K432DRAFT_423975 [Lepidopterella palustris CBS 459.81]
MDSARGRTANSGSPARIERSRSRSPTARRASYRTRSASPPRAHASGARNDPRRVVSDEQRAPASAKRMKLNRKQRRSAAAKDGRKGGETSSKFNPDNITINDNNEHVDVAKHNMAPLYGTDGDVDRTLPKNFPEKPLTCFFWHSMGKCAKRDEDCVYAHFDTGFYAAAPVTAGNGLFAVAGKNAMTVLQNASTEAMDSREMWVQQEYARLGAWRNELGEWGRTHLAQLAAEEAILKEWETKLVDRANELAQREAALDEAEENYLEAVKAFNKAA